MFQRESEGLEVSRAGLIPFAALFVLSGTAALIYEVVWTRRLSEVFGVTSFAVATVLASFMGGMALGAVVIGRWVDRSTRPLRVFAILEGGIGLYALLLPGILSVADYLFVAVHPVLPDSYVVRSFLRLVDTFGVLMIPTVLMGGTLPALGGGLLRGSGGIGRGISVLYFVNTLGAAIGTLLAGFLLLPRFGLWATTVFAFCLNVMVALTAWWLDARRVEGEPETTAERTPATEDGDASHSWPLWVAFGSGMCALVFEVVWFRILVLVFGSTVYSFSAMLSMFLTGLAVGSILIGRWVDRAKVPLRVLAITLTAAGLLTLLGSLAVNRMPSLFLAILLRLGFDLAGMNATKVVLSLVTVFPPAIAFGAVFPIVVRIVAQRGLGTGAGIGRAYAWNTVGAIVGSVAAGFVLLPTAGMETTLKGLTVTVLLFAFGCLLAEAGPVSLRWAVPIGLLIVVAIAATITGPRWNRSLLGAGVYADPTRAFDATGQPDPLRVVADYEIRTFDEGYNDTIISFESPKGKFITINGSTTASDHLDDMFPQRMAGHIPMIVHPGEPRRVCVVGLGAGVTAGAMALHDAEFVDGIELERGVLNAARFFSAENHEVLDNPKLRVRVDDGRNFLRLSRTEYDVISIYPHTPALSSSGSLYSLDFYRIVRRSLAPGGIVAQWAPISRLLPDDLASIVKTFRAAFDHVRVFAVGGCVVFVGRSEPFPPLDLETISRRAASEPVAASLLEVGVRGPVEVLSMFQFEDENVDRWAQSGSIHDDDRPVLEFLAPRGLFERTIGSNLERMHRWRPAPMERARALGLRGEWASSFVALASANDTALDAEALLEAGRPEEALELLLPVAESGHRFGRMILADYAEAKALTSQRAGDSEGALRWYEMVHHFEPDRLEGMVGVGYLELFRGNLERADALLTRAVERYPRSAGAIWRLAAVRLARGDTANAAGLLEAAIERSPTLPEPYALLGALRLGQEDFPGAVAAFDAALLRGDRSDATRAGREEAARRGGREESP